MKNFIRIGGLLFYLKHFLHYTKFVYAQFPLGNIEFSKIRLDKKSDKDSNDIKDRRKGAVESYDEYLASQIYELQVRLKSKQDEVRDSFKNRDISNKFLKVGKKFHLYFSSFNTNF